MQELSASHLRKQNRRQELSEEVSTSSYDIAMLSNDTGIWSRW